MKNSKVIAISNNKGGVLKTTTATNLAGVLAQEGKRVLLVDVDNQGNIALSFGKNADEYETTLYDVLLFGEPVEKATYNVFKNIDIIPSNDDMGFFEIDILSDAERYPEPFYLMKNVLDKLREVYDYIFIDTPPNISLGTGNALAFADYVLIPFQPETYSQRSFVKILKAINDFQEKRNPNLSILGVVGTMVDSRTSLHSEMLQMLRQLCFEKEIKCFDTVIPRSIRFASSVAYEGLPATLTGDKRQPMVHAYCELLEEIRECLEWQEIKG